MRVATWNVAWAAAWARGQILERLRSVDADVLVVTEGMAKVLPPGPHVVTAGPDWGYRVKDPQRRKVLLWSKSALDDVVTDPDPLMPPGRLVAATTTTALGPIRIIAVCVPWSHAHVTTGRKDRSAWQEHVRFLIRLGMMIEDQPAGLPLIVAGDINQCIPRRGASPHASQALDIALAPLNVVTAGTIHGLPAGTVDHIALSPDLQAARVFGIPRSGAAGKPLSDHDLIAADISPTWRGSQRTSSGPVSLPSTAESPPGHRNN